MWNPNDDLNGRDPAIRRRYGDQSLIVAMKAPEDTSINTGQNTYQDKQQSPLPCKFESTHRPSPGWMAIGEIPHMPYRKPELLAICIFGEKWNEQTSTFDITMKIEKWREQ